MAPRVRVTRSKTLRRHPVKRARKAARSVKNTSAELRQELGEAREQQTATAEVLKVISRTSFSLNHALNALIESATRLCGATHGHILQFNGEFLVFAAA